MFAFIRKHWVAYLIGATLVVALGFSVSYVLAQWKHPEGTFARMAGGVCRGCRGAQ